MTGRKVTRRASMRRKSFRSPSATRSSGTPRSTTSEPLGKSSYASSTENLDHEDSIVSKKSVSNHSLERLRQDLSDTHIDIADAEPRPVSVVSLYLGEITEAEVEKEEESKEEIVPLNSESAEERASVVPSQIERQSSVQEQKIAATASKESLADKSKSNTSLNNIKSEKSKESLVEGVKVRSKSSLNVDAAEFIPESVAVAADQTPYPEVNESEFIKKSTEDLHSISLEEPVAQADEDEVKAEGNSAAAVTAEEGAAQVDTEASVPVDSDETGKKACTERAARCRCIIS